VFVGLVMFLMLQIAEICSDCQVPPQTPVELAAPEEAALNHDDVMCCSVPFVHQNSAGRGSGFASALDLYSHVLPGMQGRRRLTR
jgi:hypothetical protein